MSALSAESLHWLSFYCNAVFTKFFLSCCLINFISSFVSLRCTHFATVFQVTSFHRIKLCRSRDKLPSIHIRLNLRCKNCTSIINSPFKNLLNSGRK